jgi:AMP-polyphosphate phosphotransferase
MLELAQQAYLETPERALLVLEGWDTAGKGRGDRRLGWTLDPRSFKVHPIALAVAACPHNLNHPQAGIEDP